MKEQILALRKEGKGYDEIKRIVGCSSSTVCYYLTPGYKERSLKKNLAIRSTKNNFCIGCGEPCNNKFCNHSCSSKYYNKIKFPYHKGDNRRDKYKSIREKYGDIKGGALLTALKNEELLSIPFESIISFDRKRKRIILEQSGKCNSCGVDKWLGRSLSLEVDHKDGNNNNDSRDNLEALCPNCHSITDTWRGRNRSDKLQYETQTTLEELKDAYIKNGNVRQALLYLGVAAKGSNYKKMYEALDAFEIPYTMQSKGTRTKQSLVA